MKNRSKPRDGSVPRWAWVLAASSHATFRTITQCKNPTSCSEAQHSQTNKLPQRRRPLHKKCRTQKQKHGVETLTGTRISNLYVNIFFVETFEPWRQIFAWNLGTVEPYAQPVSGFFMWNLWEPLSVELFSGTFETLCPYVWHCGTYICNLYVETLAGNLQTFKYQTFMWHLYEFTCGTVVWNLYRKSWCATFMWNCGNPTNFKLQNSRHNSNWENGTLVFVLYSFNVTHHP